MRVENTSDFMRLTEEGLLRVELEDSILADREYKIKISFRSPAAKQHYEEDITDCR